MNGEVTVLVERRENVLAVPNDAVRNTREAAATRRCSTWTLDTAIAEIRRSGTRWRRLGVAAERRAAKRVEQHGPRAVTARRGRGASR